MEEKLDDSQDDHGFISDRQLGLNMNRKNDIKMMLPDIS
jgi:hypothetical protein